MPFDFQPQLQNDIIRLEPLRAGDFEALYAVASDPLIWEQHPNRTRYQRPVFETFFQGAMESGGAFRVHNRVTDELIGSSRYYDWEDARSIISIGYTFLARSVWGLRYNDALKSLMLDHAFRFVRHAVFQVGASNLRSRRAMEKLGGVLIGEELVAYHGEASRPNVVYRIDKDDWQKRSESFTPLAASDPAETSP